MLSAPGFNFYGIQPVRSDPSGPAVETDGHVFPLDNNGNLAHAIGMFQHIIEFAGIGRHVKIFDSSALFGECFTSSPGVRSGIFFINQHFFRHFSFLLSL